MHSFLTEQSMFQMIYYHKINHRVHYVNKIFHIHYFIYMYIGNNLSENKHVEKTF